MNPDYTTITELPEHKVLPLQLERSYSRYAFGARFCAGRDILEIACGGGQGLGLLAQRARSVIGGDYEEKNLRYARATYQGRSNIAIQQLDAHRLPFADAQFDSILLYEAIYYLADPLRALSECRRILRPDGVLLICTANKDWPDFNPSPYSTTYFSVPELRQFCAQAGFTTEFFGAFPDRPAAGGARLRSLVKRAAVRWRLMPRTMKGKSLLKRFFFGKLVPMPRELIEGCAPYTPPVPIADHAVDTRHTAIYVVARTRGGQEKI